MIRNVILSLLISLPLIGWAQRGHSFSTGVGISYYYGDLTDGFQNIYVRPAGQISYGYYFTPAISLRFGLTYSQLGAADSLSNGEGRRKRNLHFRSPITEVSILGRYEFLPDSKFGLYYQNKAHFTPYVFGGVSIFTFDPRARRDGEWVRLQPLGTEGQFIPGGEYEDPYSLLQIAIPVGGGISYRFDNNLSIDLDIGYRFTFTDFLDDVSDAYPDIEELRAAGGDLAVSMSDPSGGAALGAPRGNPALKDGYVFAIVSFSYFLDFEGKK
ncbi:MAG: DUF6089 family protein [Bacteroidota bacterium]